MGRKAVFIDKDGTLVDDIPYNVDPALVRFSKGVIDGLKKLKTAGYTLIVVTNQSGVARGYFTEDDVRMLLSFIKRRLQEQGVVIDFFFYCPHHPHGSVYPYSIECECRKPKEGMLVHAANELGIDLLRSWMIGDILHDIEAGTRAGCRTILIDNGNETEWQLSELRIPTTNVESFDQAANYILQHELSMNSVQAQK